MSLSKENQPTGFNQEGFPFIKKKRNKINASKMLVLETFTLFYAELIH